MEKSILKSKTFWGFGVMLLVGGAVGAGLVDTTSLTQVIQTAGGIVGVWGARNAISD